MISRKLRISDYDEKPHTVDETIDHNISNHGYGKDHVKILHVNRNGPVHSVKEFEVSTRLKLYSKKDYIHGEFLLLFKLKLKDVWEFVFQLKIVVIRLPFCTYMVES